MATEGAGKDVTCDLLALGVFPKSLKEPDIDNLLQDTFHVLDECAHDRLFTEAERYFEMKGLE